MSARPPHPGWVLAAAIFLPGVGQVLNKAAQRGLVFLFFMIVLGWASAQVMPTTATWFGRHIGGIFVYGLSLLDAYRVARVNWEKWKFAQQPAADALK